MVSEGRPADVVMLGFDDFRVLAAREVDGELELRRDNRDTGVVPPMRGARPRALTARDAGA